MSGPRLVPAVLVASLLVMPMPVSGQAPPDSFRGAIWAGMFLPSDEPLYHINEPGNDGTFSRKHSAAIVQDDGWLVGGSASVRPGPWPVELRLSLAHARGTEVEIIGGTTPATGDVACFFLPCSAGAVWNSQLTVSVAQLDAVARPVGNVGPAVPRVLLGVSAQHRNYSPPTFERTWGSPPATQDTAGTRFPGSELTGALHLAPEVAVNVLGVTPYLRFGNYISLDARTAADGTAEPYLRHDLYFVVGTSLN